MKTNTIREVIRAGGLIETNSSSSHALVICDDVRSFAKPGDKEFDLDIRDGVLYVPAGKDFGWEYEKSNSCSVKLQYTCALFFNNYRPLHTQKIATKLERLLKNFLGVTKVVFEWEEEYIEQMKEDGEKVRTNFGEYCLSCPTIDHQSVEDAQESILENNNSIINFIFNKKSWWYGGNDNSSEAGGGFYSEMYYEDKNSEEDVISVEFGNLGRFDFLVNLENCVSRRVTMLNDTTAPDLYSEIKSSTIIPILDSIKYSSETKQFFFQDLTDGSVYPKEAAGSYLSQGDTKNSSPLSKKDTAVMEVSDVVFLENETKAKLLFLTQESHLSIATRCSSKNSTADDAAVGYPQIIFDNYKEGKDYLLVDLKVISKKLGDFYDIS